MKVRHDLDEAFFEEGFNERTDPFQLKDFAEKLTHIFSQLEHGTVAILDGRWGTGKSVFARQWANHLKNSGTPSIYFDAFAADYVEHPFTAVSAAFIKAAAKVRRNNQPSYDRLLTNIARASKRIGATAAKVGVKAATLGIVDAAAIDAVASIKDDLADALGDISEEVVKAALEEHASDEAVFEELKNSLKDLPNLLDVKDREEGEESHRSLVVIIDELDRCRPDFALGVLETLKHFFRSDRIHFVLVTNVNHLLLSVNHRYGMSEAALEYIQKFYDFIIHFEQPFAHDANTRSTIHARRVLHRLLPDKVRNNMGEDVSENIGVICRAYDLSLRQTEALVTNVVFAYLAIRQKEYRPTFLVCFLAVIKTLKPNLFRDIKNRSLDHEEIGQFYRQGKWPESFDHNRGHDLIVYLTNPHIEENDDVYKEFRIMLRNFHFLSRLGVFTYLANGVLDRFGRFE